MPRPGLPEDRIELFGTPPAQLAEELGGSGRARIPWQRIRRGEDPFAPGILIEGARCRLVERCHDLPLRVVERCVAECGTTKLLLELRDGARIETVIIPSAGRTTVCVSSQAGCARGCTFCVTATMGLRRSLSAAEIVGQVVIGLREVVGRDLAALRNVVFMGMGEPLDNLDQVQRAVEVITDHHALGIGPSRITLSTIGTSPQAIHRAGSLGVRLAWSLHSADPELRGRLIPGSRHDLLALRDAFVEVVEKTGEDLFVELALIAGLNDSVSDAEGVIELLAAFGTGLRINLLPLNRGREGMEPTSPARAEAFRTLLYAAGHRCIIRRARGVELGAACGQLAGGSQTPAAVVPT